MALFVEWGKFADEFDWLLESAGELMMRVPGSYWSGVLFDFCDWLFH